MRTKQRLDLLLALVMYGISFYDKMFLWFAGIWIIIYLLDYYIIPLWKKRKPKKVVK